MVNLPALFIGSALRTEEIANAIGEGLKGRVELHHRRHAVALGELNLQALQREAAECDFAVFVRGGPLYFGIGTIRYGLGPSVGNFSSTRRHRVGTAERTRFEWAFYMPIKDDHIPVMTGVDPSQRKALVSEMLVLRAVFDRSARPETDAARFR